ncbi:hypothetical protein PanWU01x14_355870, partial [Parasponia andersonii]
FWRMKRSKRRSGLDEIGHLPKAKRRSLNVGKLSQATKNEVGPPKRRVVRLRGKTIGRGI